jgi:hypothetical protein
MLMMRTMFMDFLEDNFHHMECVYPYKYRNEQGMYRGIPTSV